MAYTSAQLVAAYTAANDGVAPDAATTALLGAFAVQTQTGQLSDAAALSYVINSSQTTTQVAVETYQFFTGKTPTKAGLDFLVSPTGGNPNNLNSAYYAAFDVTNRYINFAGNLGVAGDGAAAFLATYGGISLMPDPATGISNFVNVIYETIIGSSYATAAGINVNAAKVDITSRLANFVQIAKDRGLITSTSTAAQQDIAVKAELVGYLMAEGVKADIGVYAASVNNFSAALINGSALYNVDLIGTYASAGGGTGTAVGGQGPTAGGTTLVLTTGIDALVGGVGNDTFVGDAGIANQVTTADAINGGGGSDTFRYFSFNNTAIPTLTSVENINFVSPTAGSVADLTGVVGLQFVSAENTGGITVKVGAGVTAGLTNITNEAAANETFTGTATQTSFSAILSGDTDASGIGTNGAGVLNLDGAAVTTLNIQSAGSAANRIAALASTGVETTVNITGGAALAITAALANSVTTVDASASSGGVNVILGTGGAADVTLKGGTGADTFNVGSVTGKITATLGDGNDILVLGGLVAGNTSTFDAGAGTADVISITKAVPAAGGAVAIGNFTAANKADFTNFEVVRLAATGAAATVATDVATFDATNLPAGVVSYQIGASTSGIVLNNVAANPSIAFTGSMTNFAGGGIDSGLVVNLKDATGTADAINVTFTGSSTTGRTTTALSAPGVETINIVSTGGTGASQNTITKLTADVNLSAVNITGTGPMTLTTDALTHSATINGLQATGSLIIDASATVAAGIGVNVNGGSANDNITAGLGVAAGGVAPNQLIYGGLGGDVINLGAAHVPIDTLIYKAAAESALDLVGTAGASAAVTANTGKMDVVNAFITAHDKIDLTAFGLTNTQAVIADKGTVATTDAMVTLTATSTFFSDASATARGVSEVHVGADTYLFVDVNHDGLFTASADLAIKFVGIGAIANADLLH